MLLLMTVPAFAEQNELENFYDIYGDIMLDYMEKEPTFVCRFEADHSEWDDVVYTMAVATEIPYNKLYSASAAFINEVGENYFRIGFIEEDGTIVFDIADIPWVKLKIFVFIVQVDE